MPWDIHFRHGVWLPQIEWWLDAHFPQARSFVSHAHADHMALHQEILCAPGTARLMKARRTGARAQHILPFGQTEQLTVDCTVTLHPAGHIFGSAQALLDHAEHGTLLYSGDFKLRPGLSAERCALPRARTLVMETTFGLPHYVFPPTEAVLADIAGFCHDTLAQGGVPVLLGYSLGKSQELLRGLAAAQLPVMLHPATYQLTKIYEELGVIFPRHRVFAAAEVAGHVVLCPPQTRESAFVRQIPGARTAIVTGWAIDPGAVHRHHCDAAFPLSDHADYPDLLRYVETVRPERVYTLHGFAAEFARTLRERGIEAWALGRDNQLELALGVSRARRPAPADPAQPAPAPPAAPPTLARFAATAEAVRLAPAKADKVALLAAYLAALATDDAAWAATFLSGRAFPQADPRALNLGWAVVKRAVLDCAGIDETRYRAAYRRFADAGDTTGALLRESPPSAGPATPPPLLGDLATFFDRIAAARSAGLKLELCRAFLGRLAPDEARYLVKLLTGDLRIGLKDGLLEEAIAAATGRPLAAVREANLLAGDLAAVTRAARADTLAEIQLAVFHPLQFMLASPAADAGALLAHLPPPVWIEEKFDGLRCQLHKCGERVELYGRELQRITEQFPELACAALALPGDFIVDGELLAWRDGRALPFAEIQKRLARGGDDFFLGDEVPVSIALGDLLWRDGRVLLKEPLATRRRLLEALLPARGAARFHLAPVATAHTATELEAAFMAVRQRGSEGLVAKDPASPYTPGLGGPAWLELRKAGVTLDVVVVGAEFGQGRRRELLSDYTCAVRDETAGNRLVPIGKACSGLNEAELAELTRHFLDHTLSVQDRYRSVVPDTVLELVVDLIQPSSRHPCGFALRFPRIARRRRDQAATDIDTLETCRRLAGLAPAATPELPRPATAPLNTPSAAGKTPAPAFSA